MKSVYTFLNAQQTAEKDFVQLANLLEKHFATSDDLNQMQINNTNISWIKNCFPECLNIIKWEETVVGATLILPSTQSLMQNFISGQISEAALGERLQNQAIKYTNMQAIYLCFAFVLPGHQKQGLARGLAFTSFVKSIRDILPTNKKIDLFAWIYSTAGEKLAKQISVKLKLDLFCREAKG